uniref:Guanine nucleotide-binding protein subunit gamma n=1 Tax=Poecilia formosa TaxID=48698 RepID=A0A087XD64_POEFO
MTSNSNLSNMRRLVEQLKLEASVERIKVSQAAAELQQYCLQNAGKDALLVGVPTGSNPFREPRSCAVFSLCCNAQSFKIMQNHCKSGTQTSS